jgi:hypothetical protein
MTDEWRGEGPFNRPHEGVYWRIDDGETCIAVVYTESDARLMAAAPKMVNALGAVMGICDECEFDGTKVCDKSCPFGKVRVSVDAALLAAGVEHE